MLEWGGAGPRCCRRPVSQGYRGGFWAVKRARMIRVPPAGTTLAPAERYGLDVLVDLSRLLPIEDPAAPVTEVLVAEEPRDPGTLGSLVSGGWGIAPGGGGGTTGDGARPSRTGALRRKPAGGGGPGAGAGGVACRGAPAGGGHRQRRPPSGAAAPGVARGAAMGGGHHRSEEHTSELQSR